MSGEDKAEGWRGPTLIVVLSTAYSDGRMMPTVHNEMIGQDRRSEERGRRGNCGYTDAAVSLPALYLVEIPFSSKGTAWHRLTTEVLVIVYCFA